MQNFTAIMIAIVLKDENVLSNPQLSYDCLKTLLTSLRRMCHCSCNKVQVIGILEVDNDKARRINLLKRLRLKRVI